MPLFKPRPMGLSKKGIQHTASALRKSSAASKYGDYLTGASLMGVIASAEIKLAAAFTAGAVGWLALGKAGRINKNTILAKCIGHPRASREIAKRIKQPGEKMMLILFGYGKFNESERKAIKLSALGGADPIDTNMATRALQREEKRLVDNGELKKLMKESN